MQKYFSNPLFLFFAAILLVVSFPIHEGFGAARYPSKAVTFVCPSGTGGSMDNAARGIQPYLQKALGSTVVVTNIPGASYVIATNKVFDSPADGYTVLETNNSALVRFRLMASQTRFSGDFLKAFIPVAAWLNGDVGAICVNKNSPFKTFDDLAAKAKKEGVNIGISNVGSTDHLAVLLIEKNYGGTWTVVPFASGGEAAAALMGGHIDSASMGITGAADPTKFRLLASTGSKRIPEIPDIPTFVEMGKKSLVMDFHVGAMVKAGTDPAIVKILEEAFMKAANDPEFKKWAKDTKTPVGEPENQKAWADYLQVADQNTLQILPMLEKAMKEMQKGK
jgi:tripartite-type tricarboxylate transporter receptor subunit TctC